MSQMDPVFDHSFHRELLHPKHWGAWLGVGALRLMGYLPPRLRDRLGDLLAPLLVRLSKKQCYIARTNLEICFPRLSGEEREALLHKCMRVGIKTFAGFGELSVRSPDYLASRTRISGWEHVEAARLAGQSVIFVVPHTWAIDFCGRIIDNRQTLSMCTMMKSAKSAVFDRYINRERGRNGAKIYERSAGLKPIIKHLRQPGSGFYYLPDQDHGREASLFVPFFGMEKATLPALPRLCKLTGARPLMMLACYDEANHDYELVIEPLPEPYPSEDVTRDTLVMNQAVESLLTRYPEQYMWFLKIFHTRPDTDEGFYELGIRKVRGEI
ncbi:lipid A biosynthesis acyltransferase [Aeromonas schubertii]|uniref:LpxL/LpxP family acyltransferase n=1 Tax=Aeromonas schubertii TaxID=652 RepID=UPI00067EDFD2|nr:lipid A biosynthesis acyltransferase [Aeromonas schubertii]KUE81463.1 lipid A biosynthesis acyltransferase [Aeromonas schubertii]